MINLSGPNIIFNPVNRWKVASFNYDDGTGVIEVQSAGAAQVQPVPFALSDTAGQSTGIKVNTTYTTWRDRFISRGPSPVASGMGLANALSNARAAYDNQGGNHSAKTHALELQAIADGWVDALLAGS